MGPSSGTASFSAQVSSVQRTTVGSANIVISSSGFTCAVLSTKLSERLRSDDGASSSHVSSFLRLVVHPPGILPWTRLEYVWNFGTLSIDEKRHSYKDCMDVAFSKWSEYLRAVEGNKC